MLTVGSVDLSTWVPDVTQGVIPLDEVREGRVAEISTMDDHNMVELTQR